MSISDQNLSAPTPPRNLCELFLRDVSSLLVTSKIIGRALLAIRPEYEFSRELTRSLDSIVAISEAGKFHLRQPLMEAGAVLPAESDGAASALVTSCFKQLPFAADATPGVRAAELVVNLRLLAQHIELKARLTAEEALLVGQHHLGQALITWCAEWRSCGQSLRAATIRARARAYVADVDGIAAPMMA